jgi:hypothetical protein
LTKAECVRLKMKFISHCKTIHPLQMGSLSSAGACSLLQPTRGTSSEIIMSPCQCFSAYCASIVAYGHRTCADGSRLFLVPWCLGHVCLPCLPLEDQEIPPHRP